jgi:long-subunit fatty acid transport protein
MKRLTFIAAFFMLLQVTYAGGLLTNTNQSAQFIRMMSRNASTDIDAVYFNPAGLIHLEDGWHFAFHSQTIFQTKTVESNFPLLNDGLYEGVVEVPVFPSAFAVYKNEDWAFSLGFGPNAGGGSAVYDRGLPSFEIPISKLPALISSLGVPTTSYDVRMDFEGSSIFWGLQLGATYNINDILAVSVGARYLPSVNTYSGTIDSIRVNPTHPQINPNGEMILAADFFGMAAPQYVSSVEKKTVDTKQTGFGITPIVGINISPVENLNFSLKYEMKTKLELENKPGESDNYSDQLFGEGVRNDIPAILGVGLGYESGLIEAQLSANMYFNKGVDAWGPNVRDMVIWKDRDPSQIRSREIERNGMEIGLGLQFNLLDNFAFSFGGLWGDMGVAESYQSDFSYSNPSVTAGAGIEWLITDQLNLDAGFSNTFYQDQTVSFTDPDVGPYTETLGKTTMTFAVGLSYAIF